MKIEVNNEVHLTDFIRLNEAWISQYFELEDADRALAANPMQVIQDGGYIFSAVANNYVLGVCALFHKNHGTFELARMAVSHDAQGAGIGHKLIQACFDKLTEINAKKVYLVSNTKLSAAIALYKKHGFITVFEGQHPDYARANITMERKIVAPKTQ